MNVRVARRVIVIVIVNVVVVIVVVAVIVTAAVGITGWIGILVGRSLGSTIARSSWNGGGVTIAIATRRRTFSPSVVRLLRLFRRTS